MDAFITRVDGYSQTNRHPLWLAYNTDSDPNLINEFVTSIEEGRRPQPDGESGLRSLEIAAAAYASARTGQPIQIE